MRVTFCMFSIVGTTHTLFVCLALLAQPTKTAQRKVARTSFFFQFSPQYSAWSSDSAIVSYHAPVLGSNAMSHNYRTKRDRFMQACRK